MGCDQEARSARQGGGKRNGGCPPQAAWSVTKDRVQFQNLLSLWVRPEASYDRAGGTDRSANTI